MPLAALIVELPLFGVSALLLLVAIPAAVVTATKGRWIWFAGGFVTFGVVWVIAAVAIAPPDSWWARTFYDEEQMRRATDPDRFRRPARLVAFWIGGTLAALLVLGFLAARPTAVFGVSGSALQNSLNSLASEDPCDKQGSDTWICAAYDGRSSGTVPYRVTVKRLGCWSATRVGGSKEGSRKHLSGCVTALDYLF